MIFQLGSVNLSRTSELTMSKLKNGSGSCSCGAVRFSTNKMPENTGACHCSICTKLVAGPFLEVECGADITFLGIENISIFNSSE